MYRLFYFLGIVVRQFLLPNPFSPLGGIGEIINLIASVVFVPLSYAQTGMVYDRGSAPAAGSILFTFFYGINTGVTYLIMLLYPITWLMILAAIVYVIGLFVLLGWIRNRSIY